MIAVTVLRATSADPIPRKSSQLFIPQIDVSGPQTRYGDPHADETLPPWLPHRDSMILMQARRGIRQTVMYSVHLDVAPSGARAFGMHARAMIANFFKMFAVPFHAGEVRSLCAG